MSAGAPGENQLSGLFRLLGVAPLLMAHAIFKASNGQWGLSHTASNLPSLPPSPVLRPRDSSGLSGEPGVPSLF